MNILEQKTENGIGEIKVELTWEELEKEFEKGYRKKQKNVEMPGFRKGKVPLSMVKKQYAEVVQAETIDSMINSSYPEMLEETGLRPVAPGEIKDIQYFDGERVEYVAVVELKPEFELADWQSEKLQRDIPEISDEQVTLQLEQIRKDKAIVRERDKDENAVAEDILTVDIQKLDESGVPIIGDKHEDARIPLNENILGENTDTQLIGVKLGETRKITSTEESTDEQGNPVVGKIGWEILVKKIEEISLPDLDDDLAVQVSEEFKTLDDLKSGVKKSLQDQAQYMANQRLSNRMIDKMIELHDFPLPPTLMAETLERLIDSHKQQNEQDHHHHDHDHDHDHDHEHHHHHNNDHAALEKEYAPVAEKQLKWYFIRDKLIKLNNLQPTEEAIDEEIQKYADRSGRELEQLKLIFKQGEMRENLEREILDGKVMELLRNGFKYDDRTTTLDELYSQSV
ncbi:trigger factor [bacterium]|nr:trigger factor [bacterium]